MARMRILGAFATLALAGCDSPDSGYGQYGETSQHHAERVACEQDNRVNQKAANDLAYQGRYREADTYARTNPTRACPAKP